MYGTWRSKALIIATHSSKLKGSALSTVVVPVGSITISVHSIMSSLALKLCLFNSGDDGHALHDRSPLVADLLAQLALEPLNIAIA